VNGRKRQSLKKISKIKQNCRTIFTKQLSLVNLAVISIIVNNHLTKYNIVSRVKMLKCRLDRFGTAQLIN